MGRGVSVKNFGTFTFSAPEVILDVMTSLIYEGCDESRLKRQATSITCVFSGQGICERKNIEGSHSSRTIVETLSVLNIWQYLINHDQFC